MKLAVLTSGGDSAGMNTVVCAVVKARILSGCESWIIREGHEVTRIPSTTDESSADYSARQCVRSGKVTNLVENLRFGDGGLLRDGAGDCAWGRTLKGRYIVRAGWDDVRGWFADGDTLINTACSKTFRSPVGRLAAAYNLVKEGIDALVVCGGDGSLTGADLFCLEWPPLVSTLHSEGKITDEQPSKHGHLPLHRICEAIDSISPTAASHSRVFVLEVMGRHCGWLALLAGVRSVFFVAGIDNEFTQCVPSAGADFIFIPERPPQTDSWENEIGQRETLVIISEGTHDSNLKPIRADYVGDIPTKHLGLDSRSTTLRRIQRSRRPCAFHRIRLIGSLPCKVEAVKAVLEAMPDTPSYMIGVRENKLTRVPLMEAMEMMRAVADAIADKDFAKAMSLRDPEFLQSLEGFMTTSLLYKEKALSEDKRMRVAIMHIGAPAGGMNAAARAALRYCIKQGHIPLAVHNGLEGLLDGMVSEKRVRKAEASRDLLRSASEDLVITDILGTVKGIEALADFLKETDTDSSRANTPPSSAPE
ncbi:phosphofructokinase-domain-containing protein [Pisolithus albus]|nr:phosphofructokinase-domain-containing protein [Pisolithus albus]